MPNPIEQSFQFGQSTWCDNISRNFLASGQMTHLINIGVRGVTSNPTIFEKAISGGTDYDNDLLEMLDLGKTPSDIFEALAINDIRTAADLLRPTYDDTKGLDGYVSLEVRPTLAHDTVGTISEARRLYGALDRPNVMIKVPATTEGIPAVHQLISEGINVNVTLVFSLESYRKVIEAYISGIEALVNKGRDPSRVSSVASFFVSRVDTAIDPILKDQAREGENRAVALLGKAAIANAQIAYSLFNETFQADRFEKLRAKGARVQRPLWASTSTKNPAYSDTLYVDSLIGRNTVNTMPPNTLDAAFDHGSPAVTLDGSKTEAELTFCALAELGIDMNAITAKLLTDGVTAFTQSYETILDSIHEKQAKLRHLDDAPFELGSHTATVTEAIRQLRQDAIVTRIWRKDHTIWKTKPREITNRLGWLTSPKLMSKQVPMLERFVTSVINDAFHQVVLLGMGGTSLGPEVLRETFGSAPGHPEFHIFDSTIPDNVRWITNAIDPVHTLFIVSSKSGDTIEVASLYRHFRALMEQQVGPQQAGAHFVAITDQGSPLEALAKKDKFRHVFLNQQDIGGRFSVLSYFGLVPAALIGLDVAHLLKQAILMSESCATDTSESPNPGLWLGALIGSLATNGLDKLTLITSPSLKAFGLWVEQLLAESLGKEKVGIIPVTGEPICDPSKYGTDRVFVYFYLLEDEDVNLVKHLSAVEKAGHMVLRIPITNQYDLAGEFYKWEFATSIAGNILGVHPFDQPNVQSAKDQTKKMLGYYEQNHRFDDLGETVSIETLLHASKPGNYLAVQAYIPETPEINDLLIELRSLLLTQHCITTTVGYGPRYLHSTGQLHKGGPASGLYLQLTSDTAVDVPIPGKDYTFDVLARCQALGDAQALKADEHQLAIHHLGADPALGLRKLVDYLSKSKPV